MRCSNCSHAQVDHAGIRCVVRTERLHRATGVTVVDVCGCKRFAEVAATPAPVAPVAPEPVEDVADESPEAEDAPRRFGRRRASQPVEPTT